MVPQWLRIRDRSHRSPVTGAIDRTFLTIPRRRHLLYDCLAAGITAEMTGVHSRTLPVMGTKRTSMEYSTEVCPSSRMVTIVNV